MSTPKEDNELFLSLRRPLTDEEIARDYTEKCIFCDGPCRPKDEGQCMSCWKLEHLT